MDEIAASASPNDTDNRLERIRAAIATLEPLQFELLDESEQHRGHAGARDGGGHFRMRIVSPRFNGLNRMARHRLVYDLLVDLMRRDIHALSLTLLAPDEG